MRNGHPISAIQIKDFSCHQKVTKYELDITIGNDTISYEARYSELFSLFGQKNNIETAFPSKQNVTTFLNSVLPPKIKMHCKSSRFNQLKKYFQILSNDTDLSSISEFWQLVKLARKHQHTVPKSPKPCRMSYSKMLRSKEQQLLSKQLYVII